MATFITLDNLATFLDKLKGLFAKKSELPTRTSELQNDSGFLTQHQDLSGKQDALTMAQMKAVNSGVTSEKLDGIDAAIGSKAEAADLAAVTTSMQDLQDALQSLTGIGGSDFLGIYATQSALPNSRGWGLVGSNLSQLQLFVNNGSGWSRFGTDTYDFTDYDDVKGALNGMRLTKPMTEDEWSVLTANGTSTGNLTPNTIYMTIEEEN